VCQEGTISAARLCRLRVRGRSEGIRISTHVVSTHVAITLATAIAATLTATLAATLAATVTATLHAALASAIAAAIASAIAATLTTAIAATLATAIAATLTEIRPASDFEIGMSYWAIHIKHGLLRITYKLPTLWGRTCCACAMQWFDEEDEMVVWIAVVARNSSSL